MKRKPVTGISRKSESELLSFASHLLASMNANLNFPSPEPPLAVIQTAHDELKASVSTWERGNARKSLDKNNKKKALIDLISKLANYVELIADGDPDKIISSGFEISKEQREAAAIPVAPLISEMLDGIHSGTVVVVVKGGVYGQIISVSYRQEEDTNWKVEFGKTRRDVSIEDLQAGKYYVFKAAISNSAGTSEWSPEQRFVVR
ncbi:MAG TPA: hypothetical protein DIT07_04005 [Sphingobacteriaceae bacterium]|nr:hypothetical protein [Sphingobacteriaceae bacterium]